MGNTSFLTKNDFTPGVWDIFLTVTDSVGASISVPADPNDPTYPPGHRIKVIAPLTASITSPSNGDTFEELDEIHFQGSYSGGKYPYSCNWTSSIDGNLGNRWQFNTRNLSVGVHNITLTVTDSHGDIFTDNIILTVNAPCSVKGVITSPRDQDAFTREDSITFDSLSAGSIPPYTYTWISSIDGNIGNSPTFNISNLSCGDHIITFIVTDSIGKAYTDSIEIHIPPDIFDWRDVNGSDWMTPVKLQSCGDCANFAMIGATEAKYNIQENDPNLDIDLSEQYFFNCYGAGSYQWNFLISHGVPDENCYPYRGYPNCYSPCPSTCDNGSRPKFWKITGVGEVNTVKIADVQYLLTKKGPIATQLAIGFSHDDKRDKDGGYIFTCTGGDLPNHAVVLVGYDNIGKYWIIKNSWGTGWANGGYASLDYNTCTRYIVGGGYSYYVEGVVSPQNG